MIGIGCDNSPCVNVQSMTEEKKSKCSLLAGHLSEISP